MTKVSCFDLTIRFYYNFVGLCLEDVTVMSAIFVERCGVLNFYQDCALLSI